MYFSLFFIQKIYRVGFLLVLCLVLLDLIAVFSFPNTLLSDLFTATREQTPLTWLSALAFFFIGLASLSIYYQGRSRIWYFLATLFFFFSLDDAVYFHERISGYIQNHSAWFDFFPSYIWVVIYFPMMAFGLGALFFLLWRESAPRMRRFLFGAFLVLGLAISLDLLDGWMQKSESSWLCQETTCRYVTLHVIRLFEEIMEVLALGTLGYLLLTNYCTKKRDGVD